MSRFWSKARFGLGIFASLIFSWLAMRELAWSEVIVALRTADWRLLPPSCLLMGLTWGIFAIRWRVLLSPVTAIRWSDTFSYIMIGYLGNLVFPLRLGDVSRVALISRRHGIDIGFTSATAVLDKLLDVLTLVALGGGLMLAIPMPELIRRGVQAAIVTGAGAALAADVSVYEPPPLAPAYSPVSAYNWTGPYAGLVGGYGWARGTVSNSGWIGGAYAGANFQANSNLVVGVEGDFTFTSDNSNFLSSTIRYLGKITFT